MSFALPLAHLVFAKNATAACLGGGAPGGLFTPTLTIGALFGALLGHGWATIWPSAPPGSYAIIGGAAVLAAAMQGPLAAVVLMLELTRAGDGLMVPILLAVTGATVVARRLGAPSIYSARLSPDDNLAGATRCQSRFQVAGSPDLPGAVGRYDKHRGQFGERLDGAKIGSNIGPLR